MKNKGILIAGVLVVICIAAYFLLKSKSAASNSTVTQTRESTTGVAALFNTGAMSSLFGGLGLGKGSNSFGGGSNGASGSSTKSPMSPDQSAALGTNTSIALAYSPI